MTAQVKERLLKALERLPGIEKRIVERQPTEKAQQGKQRLAELGADIANALTALGGEVPTLPINDAWKNIPTPKDDAIRGKRFDNSKWMKDADKDYVDCVFSKGALQSDTIAPNIRLFNPTFVDLDPWAPGGSNSTFGFYINMGKKGEQRLGFGIYGGRVVGLTATEFMETKDFDPEIIDLDLTQSPGIERGIRIRHGAHALIYGCKGLKKVTFRGHHHACVNCPDTGVAFLAGNLPGEFSKWIGPKREGKGNYQRAEHCYAEGVKFVQVGAKMQESITMKAYRCMLAPGQKHELLMQEEFKEKKLSCRDDLESEK